MINTFQSLRWALGIVATGVILSGCSPSSVPKDDDKHAFVGATLWSAHLDSEIEDSVLLVHNSKVVSVFAQGSSRIPPEYNVVDLSGYWIVPGLVSGHGHVLSNPGFHTNESFNLEQAVQEQLNLYARYGVTTIFSLGNEPDEAFLWRDRSQSEDYTSARLFVAGSRLEVYSTDDANAIIETNLARQPDYLKIAVDSKLGRSQKMPEEVYASIIETGKENGLFVAAHFIELEDGKGLIRAGVGYLAHSVRDKIVDDEFIDLMKRNDICLSPTLMREVSVFTFASRPEFVDDPLFIREAHPDYIGRIEAPETQERYNNPTADWARDISLPNAQINMMKLHDAGATIVMGPDSGPGLRPQGFQERMEMEMMETAGMSAEDVLRASTFLPAKCLKQDEAIGTLQAGRWADFLVLSESPLETVKSFRSLRRVYIGGRLFHDTDVQEQ